MLLLLRSSDVSNDPRFLLALLIPFSTVFVVLALVYYFGKKRTKDLAAVASTLGFVPAEEVPLVREMPIFGHSVTLTNIFVGSLQGYEATFFDLRVNQGKSSYTQTIAGFRKSGLAMPAFQVHATHFADRIAAHFSSQIVAIDSDPEFARRYTVRSPTKEECQRFFRPEVTSYLAQLPPHEWTLEGSGDWLIVYRYGACSPSKIGDFLNETGNLAAGLLGMVRPTSVI